MRASNCLSIKPAQIRSFPKNSKSRKTHAQQVCPEERLACTQTTLQNQQLGEYNDALRHRGNIEIWIDDVAIKNWYERDRVYDGAGTPKLFSDFAILVCHEIRQVYKLPLRQCQGFINSIFKILQLPIQCPDYSCLSKRLSVLGIQSPRYTKTETSDGSIAAIAIDSTGLKRFGRDGWHARELSRQKNEALIGCGCLNKMTGLGMSESYRVT